jgi:hypothetical protein
MGGEGPCWQSWVRPGWTIRPATTAAGGLSLLEVAVMSIGGSVALIIIGARRYLEPPA